MLLHIVARGKIGRSPEAELVDRYLKRISLADEGQRASRSRRHHARAPHSTACRSSLDERGQALSSAELAAKLESWRDGGKREARFLIGAADGHGDDGRAEADLLLSFGPATWPHLLARAMLAEQLFRATSILANHPYHREG